MVKARNNHHLYIGRAGHLVAMAECLSRGWNVAIPEVDVGEDIFVVEDESSKLAKVQVKTATGKTTRKGFKAQFKVPYKQLSDTSAKGNDLRFIFVVRFNGDWQPYIIMTRAELEQLHLLLHIGTKTQDVLMLTFYYLLDTHKVSRIECGTQRGIIGLKSAKPDLSEFINKWDKFFAVRILEGN